jgi:hypothetical protein
MDDEPILVKKEHLPPGIVIIVRDNGKTYRIDGPEIKEGADAIGGEFG